MGQVFEKSNNSKKALMLEGSTSNCLNVCCWPLAVLGNVENYANSMTALRRVAVVRQG